jgi:hypothetical protein
MLLPLMLILVGIGLLGGCFYVPGSDKVPAGERDMQKLVGKPKSQRPIRIGQATRDDVVRIAGYPNGISNNGRSWTYAWSAQNGGWFQPLCFNVAPAWRNYTLTLEFADDGRVKRSRINHKVQEFNPLESSGGPEHRNYVDPADLGLPTTRRSP